jgi:ribosomal protein S18 acetylase RimI-like enzyme
VSLCLVPMTDEQFRSWSSETIERYAREVLRTRRCSWPDAQALARRAFGARLPEGLSTVNTFLRVMTIETGITVGSVWYSIRSEGARRTAFICDLLVHEDWRRRGFGRQALVLVEAAVRDVGAESVGLNVFETNGPAQAMYRALGYSVVSAFMEKVLSPDSP